MFGHVEAKLSSEYLVLSYLSYLEAGELGLDPVKAAKYKLGLDLVPSIWFLLNSLRLENFV